MTPTPSPLIVCGFGRSGTRSCASYLANSNAVELQGEIPQDIVGQTMDWLAAAKAAGAGDGRHYDLARNAYRNVGKARPINRPAARWFGHKTPHHERWFDANERLFDDPERRPRYVYCLRNPEAVWRSYRAMPWNGFRDVRAFLKSWARSVETFEAMRRAAPDRVLLFNLDAMLIAADAETHVRAALFDPLDLSSESFRQPFDALGNRNSAEAKFGAPPTALPDRDRDRIRRDPRVARIAANYFPSMIR